MHRVLGPTGAGAASELTPRRQSIAFFCNPNANTLVECLPGCMGTGAKYPPVQSEDYLVKRLVASPSQLHRQAAYNVDACAVLQRLTTESATDAAEGSAAGTGSEV